MKASFFKFVLVVQIGLLSACSVQPKEKKPPNIIFIMSDDHGYQAVSAYGYGLNQTPNIDRLASEGTLFTRASVTNSICAPSRAVMLTGKHSFVNGKVDNMQAFDWGQNNFPKLLQKAGYSTALIGKIHLNGLPTGFDYSAVLPGQGHYYNPEFIINGEKQQIPGYVTDITTDMAIEWLEKQKSKNGPFCLLYHQKAPHREWMPAIRHFKEYTQKTFPEPETLFDDYKGRGTAANEAEMNILKDMNWGGDSKIWPERMDELGLKETLSWDKEAYLGNTGRMNAAQKAAWDSVYTPIIDEFSKKYPDMSEKELMRWRYQRYLQDYLGCIAGVDEGVGRVLDYLDENDLTDNTIVVYTSDQGFYLGEHGWFDKRFMYEESFRTPLLIRYPGHVKSGIRSDALVQNLDYAPTFLDYANVEIPDDMQGRSMRPLLNGESTQWREAVYYTYYEYPSIHMVKRHYGIATSRFKLIHFYYDVDEWELYDLETDPQELNNVYDDPDYLEVRGDMHHKLDSIRSHYGDSDANDDRFLKTYLKAIK